MFGSDRTVAVTLKATVSDYVSKMGVAKSATADMAKAAEQHATKNRQSWDAVGKGMMVVGAAIAAGVGVAVKAYADFDKEMSNVRAVSGANAAEMKRLSSAALEAGAATAFSASEAARATAELAKVGLSTKDILGGALRGALDLAAAGSLDLASAAEIAGQTMKIFKLEGKDVPRIADALAAGANKSAADVTDLSQALAQAGLQAAQTGMSMEDTVGTLSLFADNALKGSDAGTSLKTMLSRLNPTTKQAAVAMEELGLNFYDAQGNFIGIEAAAGLLKSQLSGLTVQQRQAALQTIFGSDAIRAATVLYDAGAEGVRTYTQAVTDHGAAARMAAIQMDNLAGDWEQFTGSVETALIKAGSGANDMIRTLVQAATGMVNVFADMPDSVQSVGVAIAAVASALLLAGGGFLAIVPKIAAAKTAMVELGITSTAVRGLLSGPWGLALAAGTLAIGLFAAGQYEAKRKADELRATLDQQTGAITGNTKAMVARDLQQAGAFETARKYGVTARELTDAALGQGDALSKLEARQRAAASTNADFVRGQFEAVKSGGDFSKMALLASSSSSVFADASTKSAVASRDQANGLQGLLNLVRPTNELLTGQSQAQQEVAAATGEASAAAADAVPSVKSLADATRDAKREAEDAAKVYKEWQSQIEMLGGGIRAETAARNSYNDAVKTGTEAIKGSAVEQEQALLKIAEAATQLASKQMDAGRGQEEIAGTMRRSREDFLRVAEAMGWSAQYAADYADALGLIPENVQTMVEAAGVLESTAEVIELDTQIRNLSGKTVTVEEAGADASNGRVLTLSGSIFNLPDKTVEVKEIGATASGERVVSLNGQIYRLTGKTVVVSADTSRASANLAAVASQLAAIQSKNITLTVSRIGGVNVGQYATGGFVSGPGTSTSDSIPALLSNGEYVMKAAAVAKYGTHFFDRVNAMRFSSGGEVTRTARASAPATTVLDASPIAAALNGARLKLGPIDPITREVAATLLTAHSRGV